MKLSYIMGRLQTHVLFLIPKVTGITVYFQKKGMRGDHWNVTEVSFQWACFLKLVSLCMMTYLSQVLLDTDCLRLCHVKTLFSACSYVSFPITKWLYIFKVNNMPWLVRLSGFSAGLRTESLLVHFPVRAHAWVAGQVPRWGSVWEATNRCFSQTFMFLSLSFSVPSPLSKNK